MDRLGNLLELIETAPVGLRTLTGSLWHWTHLERSRWAIDEMSRRGGNSISRLTLGGERSGVIRDETLRVWLDFPNRWRLESADRLDIKDGDNRWIGDPHQVIALENDRSNIDQTEVGILVEPGPHVFGGLQFETPVHDEIDGRLCWKSNSSRTGSHGHMPMYLGLRLGGIDHTFWFDAETGIVLRHVGLIDREPCRITELKDVVINQPIPGETFQFIPPLDAVVESQFDRLLHMAETQGVDLTDVDRSNVPAVRKALANRGHPHVGRPEMRLEMRRAKHIPADGPPDDEARARSLIEYAYSHDLETDDTGEVLLNIQGGRGLSEYLRQARQRIAEGDVRFVVDDVKFLRPDEAVVWFSLEIDGNRPGLVVGREGRALLIDGRWVIEHATLVDLLGIAGVAVPPNL
jgi:hypothetical protein